MCHLPLRGKPEEYLATNKDDARKHLIVIWAMVGFKRTYGEWSVSFLVARCLLVPKTMSIPRAEMEGLVGGANMMWMLRQILVKWVETFILAGDAGTPVLDPVRQKQTQLVAQDQ